MKKKFICLWNFYKKYKNFYYLIVKQQNSNKKIKTFGNILKRLNNYQKDK